MIIYQRSKQVEAIALLSTLQANSAGWQLVSIRLPPFSKQYQDQITQSLFQAYSDTTGLILSPFDYKIVMLLNLDEVKDYTALNLELKSHLAQQDMHISSRKISAVDISTLELYLSASHDEKALTLYKQREQRQSNVFLIAEDDVFISWVLSTVLNKYGEVHQVVDGALVLDEYIKCNPDIVFLDIHLPNKDGLSLLNEITALDIDAYILIASADSLQENIDKAMESGAAGFLAKPIKKETVLDCLKQCTSFEAK